MAFITINGRVFVHKGIICIVMIKLILLQRNYFKLLTLMIGMALDAWIGIFCMDALPFFDSSSKLVMAIKAFTIRDAATEGMTLSAILDPLILAVGRRKLPRIYQRPYTFLGQGIRIKKEYKEEK